MNVLDGIRFLLLLVGLTLLAVANPVGLVVAVIILILAAIWQYNPAQIQQRIRRLIRPVTGQKRKIK